MHVVVTLPHVNEVPHDTTNQLLNQHAPFARLHVVALDKNIISSTQMSGLN